MSSTSNGWVLGWSTAVVIARHLFQRVEPHRSSRSAALTATFPHARLCYLERIGELPPGVDYLPKGSAAATRRP
jgi:hypothetical protein